MSQRLAGCLVVIAALSSVVLACSSSDDSKGSGASSSSGGSSSGNGASSSSGGASSTSSSGSTPGGDTFGDATCAHYEKCSPSALAPFGDKAACAAAINDRIAKVKAAKGYNVDAAKLAACASKLASQACGAPEPAECSSPGTLAAGAACEDDGQCAGGTCLITSGRCGTCGTLGKVGAECGDGKPDCEEKLACSVAGKCVALVAAGGACDDTAAFCADDLRCVGAKCVKPAAEGEACTADGSECAIGLECTNAKCAKAVAPTIKLANVGEACDEEAGTVCRASYCDFDGTKKCVAFKKDGDACQDDTPCLPFHKCFDGKCGADDPGFCK